ncbi:MAG: radical SAM protein, partial [Ilumatobacteraceae bacterium]|nr:radical SAM protein [Ilumatobacteraceae bacterium]
MSSPRPTQAAFHLLAKPTGAICNLDCTYCFFLSKDALYPGESMRMSRDTLQTYLQQLLSSQPDGPVSVAWQGGEPTLMGLDFYRSVITLIAQYARPAQIIEHTMQTNGTLLTDEWAVFLKQNNVLVGLSIDGPQEMHDEFRVWKDGRGSFNDVFKAWELLDRYQVETNILCSLNSANVDRPLEVYTFFRDVLKAKHLQFIPIVERANPETLPIAEKGWSDKPGRRRILYTQSGSLVTSRSITGQQYGNFLNAIFDEWVKRDVGEI